MKARIKIGSGISHDMGFGKWPTCKPPMSEYEGETYKNIAKNPDMEFDVEWRGGLDGYWDCKADGYGYHANDGGAYGNGSIFVRKMDGIVFLSPDDAAKWSEKRQQMLLDVITKKHDEISSLHKKIDELEDELSELQTQTGGA